LSLLSASYGPNKSPPIPKTLQRKSSLPSNKTSAIAKTGPSPRKPPKPEKNKLPEAELSKQLENELN